MCGSEHDSAHPEGCHHDAGPEGGHFIRAHACDCGTGMPRHLLRPLILLLLAEKPCHGYELIARLGELELGLDSMDPSIIYRVLRHMENEGLATSRLNDSGSGPARKVYELTPEGLDVLDAWSVNLGALDSMLKRFDERYRDYKSEVEE
jgi:PadR family transcriptional regulator PadR